MKSILTRSILYQSTYNDQIVGETSVDQDDPSSNLGVGYIKDTIAPNPDITFMPRYYTRCEVDAFIFITAITMVSTFEAEPC